MKQCETCGNHYENILEVRLAGKTYFFDSFECAITKLAPTCKHCSCLIIGHGVSAANEYYCCEHCVRSNAQ